MAGWHSAHTYGYVVLYSRIFSFPAPTVQYRQVGQAAAIIKGCFRHGCLCGVTLPGARTQQYYACCDPTLSRRQAWMSVLAKSSRDLCRAAAKALQYVRPASRTRRLLGAWSARPKDSPLSWHGRSAYGGSSGGRNQASCEKGGEEMCVRRQCGCFTTAMRQPCLDLGPVRQLIVPGGHQALVLHLIHIHTQPTPTPHNPTGHTPVSLLPRLPGACLTPLIMATRRRLPCFCPLRLAAALSLLLASTHGFVLAMALKTPKPTFGGIAHAGILVSDTQASLVRSSSNLPLPLRRREKLMGVMVVMMMEDFTIGERPSFTPCLPSHPLSLPS